MKTELGTLDRVTLTAWRFVNEAGWTAMAFVLASAAHLALTIWLHSRALVTSSAFDLNARAGAEDGIDELVTKFGLRIGLTALIAVLIGKIVGGRVWRRQALYAAVAAATYVVFTLVWFEYSTSGESVTIFSDGAEQVTSRRTTLIPAVLYDLVVAAAIPAAAWVARRVVHQNRALPVQLTD